MSANDMTTAQKFEFATHWLNVKPASRMDWFYRFGVFEDWMKGVGSLPCDEASALRQACVEGLEDLAERTRALWCEGLDDKDGAEKSQKFRTLALAAAAKFRA